MTQTQIEGLDRLEAKLTKLGMSVAVLAPAAERAMELRVEADAKRRCPVGEYPDGSNTGGNLRGSIHTATQDTGDGVQVTTGTPVEYAAFVEYGTGERGAASGVTPEEGYEYGSCPGMTAQPYLRPAWDQGKGAVTKDLAKAVRRELAKL